MSIGSDYREATLRQARERGWPRVTFKGRPSDSVEGEENWRKLVEVGSAEDVQAAREGMVGGDGG